MALRVLLADESNTIKKVFQLVLQDFGIELTVVNVGSEVINVAMDFKPDIIFADVLLQKKNGYEVCQEIRSHSTLNQVPVILIWSGFMELDQQKFKTCRANDHLEKPFDTTRLRQMVQKYIPRLQTHPLTSYLTFPTLPDFQESPKETPTQLDPLGSVLPQAPNEATQPTSTWSMDAFEPLEVKSIEDDLTGDEFVSLDLPPPKSFSQKPMDGKKPMAGSDDSDEVEWVQKSLSNYKIPKVADKPTVKFNIPEGKDESGAFFNNPNFERNTQVSKPSTHDLQSTSDDGVFELDFDADPESESAKAAPDVKPVESSTQMSAQELETIIRAQSTEVIEKVVWQIVPEIATRIIERELQRLLKERNDE